MRFVRYAIHTCFFVAVLTPLSAMSDVTADDARPSGGVACDEVFAPSPDFIHPTERPHRDAVCLNGRWRFQPVDVPSIRSDSNAPPELPPPTADGWDRTPIKIPSPWNVNRWGAGRDVGEGTPHPYWPSSVYYPSYPRRWDDARMGWLARAFNVPTEWRGRRIVLHFEAVAGEAQVFVNGRLAGRHFDDYLPFEVDVTDLVRFDRPNELRVGVRAHSLFDERSERFSKMRMPYPNGSETERLVGIWQDVHLVAKPNVRVEDVFIKPNVADGQLRVDFVACNDSGEPRTIGPMGRIRPWINLAEREGPAAAIPKSTLGDAVLSLVGEEMTLAPGERREVSLTVPVGGELKNWTPDAPNLYMCELELRGDGETLDVRAERFGWRQFMIDGSDLLLNGEKIQLVGDLLHPFGPFITSRSYVWAWYRMIKDFGGNAARPHAQIHPRAYLDLADEMGIVVLDETAIFGSSIALNLESPVAWRRFETHCEGLVRRDRNHPSVVGWSFGNEMFAIFEHNGMTDAEKDRGYERLIELGRFTASLDPTRPWISCDGDEDLRGTLPIWSRHFGHDAKPELLPEIYKPLMVGEAGGSYYARPRQLAVFNGPRAYESYEGRNEALAIDVYDNITRMALPHLAYYSASETAWFGLEHLPLGYDDFQRLPNADDGVFFTRPYEDGAPGMQVERIPPYVCTLNPGWDSRLPLYRPLAMFEAMRSALDERGPQPSPWDHRVEPSKTEPPAVEARYTTVAFVGPEEGLLHRRMRSWGVPFSTDDAASFVVFDAAEASGEQCEQADAALKRIEKDGGVLLVMLGASDGDGVGPAAFSSEDVRLTDREATALTNDSEHPITAAFTLPDLYFAEEGADRVVMRHGLDGPMVRSGRALLTASNADWSLFNNAPESAKCAAAVLYEQLEKPSGAALVECPHGRGTVLLCTVDHRIASRTMKRFWRTLIERMGVRLTDAPDDVVEAFDMNGALIRALSIGRFEAADLDAAETRAFISTKAIPRAGETVAGRTWGAVESPSRDRFVFREMKQQGDATPCAVYFSFWIKSPRSLDDLLADGPDAARFTLHCYAADRCRLWLNGAEETVDASAPADYRTRSQYDALPLKRGWNHFLVKVASSHLLGDEPGTLAVRMTSDREEFLRHLESAVEAPKSESTTNAGR